MANVPESSRKMQGHTCLQAACVRDTGQRSEAACPAMKGRGADLQDLYEGHRKGHVGHIAKVKGPASAKHDGQEACGKKVGAGCWAQLHRAHLAVQPRCRYKITCSTMVLCDPL